MCAARAPAVRPASRRSFRTEAARPGGRAPLPIAEDALAETAPSLRRDPWLWTSAFAPALLLLQLRGAPLGEPFAEDFDFLHRALLEPSNPWLDGGGSQAFWRPVAHQLYYEILGPLVLTHPAVVAAIHLALLALATVLVYRVLRPAWPGPLAAAAATFPLLSESTRTLIAWPSHFVDLGLYLFSALALHEASRRRLPGALAALAAALLCKELALVTAALLPFTPRADGAAATGRVRVLVGVGVVVVAWALVYQYVRASAGLELPHALERDPSLVAAGPLERLGWALHGAGRALFSLPLRPGPPEGIAALTVAAVGLAAAIAFARDPAARARFAAVRVTAVWALVWALAAAASLASIYPLWSPNRAHFAAAGAGIAAVAVAGAAHPAAAATLVASRAGLFAIAPPPARRITPEPEDRGAFIDVPRLTRLQRLMRTVRRELAARHPTLPRGAAVGYRGLPLATEYAFGGSRALRLWYRDTTLTFVPYETFRADPDRAIVTVVAYQPRGAEIVLLDPDAVRAQIDGVRRLEAGAWAEAVAALDRSDALQRDRRAIVFLGDNAGRRAYALAALGELDRARAEAHRAIAAAPEDVGARYVVALVAAARRDTAAAAAQLDTVFAHAPDFEEARALERLIRPRARAGRP